ncbi:MAG TPA: helicase C-terminal domain-containing protein [Ignavibacteria bacterium]
MLEVRKNTFSRSYENSFFREFSRYLFHSFQEKNINGVLIGSPDCVVNERLQIDALLLTSNVVCIIDFKNFEGKIKLPPEKDFETGIWANEKGERIKGGSSNSPYTQLKMQKTRFIDVFNKHIKNSIHLPETFNPLHTVRIVCFQNKIELIGKIPSKEELNFFILDKTNYLQKILDVTDVSDKEVLLKEDSFNAYKKIFRADVFKFDEKTYEDDIDKIESKSFIFDYNKLYDDQKEALSKIKSFLKDPEQKIFVLQGTTNSGKSHLISYIQETAYNSNIQEVEIFAASGRIAKNLLSMSGLERIYSIYSYIYGGQHTEEGSENEVNEENSEEKEEHKLDEELELEKVPLKKCNNSDNALFIVDESQLVSDSLYHSIDLIFGSGHLLRDFIEFAELKGKNRKIIFIGDPYQLNLGNTDESPLNPSYLENHYKIKTSCFQLNDKEKASIITEESLKCVKSIRNKSYNSLKFKIEKNFTILERNKFKEYTYKVLKENSDAHFLYFSNEEAQKTNIWIKKNILNNGEDICKGDLVLFNNNISIENVNDPNARPIKINNGQFAIVIHISDTFVPEELKDIKDKLYFRYIDLILTEGNNSFTVLSLENYRCNPKAELSKNETKAIHILLNRLVDNYLNDEFAKDSVNEVRFNKEISELKLRLEKGERVKTKLRNKLKSVLQNIPTSIFYKFKYFAELKFGWAMTVHKSMSYKWDEIIFNVNQGENHGINNENYFRWVYTGISRAKKKVNLINYKPITPFTNTQLIDNNNGEPESIFFISENENHDLRLDELKDFISSKIKNSDFSIENIEHFNWQERYTYKNKANQKIKINFGFNGQGKFRFHVASGGNNDISSSLIKILNLKKELESFETIKDDWKKNEYNNLKIYLNKYGIKFEFILQSAFRDKITLYSGSNILSVEMIYNGIGLFSSISAIYYSNISIWNDFKMAIQEINN